MKKISILLLLLSSLVLAEDDKPIGYVYVDTVMYSSTKTGTTQNFNPKGMKWAFGYLLGEYTIPVVDIDVSTGLEFDFITNTSAHTKENVISSSTGINLGKVTASIDNIYALYLKTPISIAGKFDFNTYVGMSSSSLTLKNKDFTISDNQTTSLSYGFGLEYMLPQNISVHASYMQYFSNLSSIDIGLGVKF
jgi:opacity protein-like surface antigen